MNEINDTLLSTPGEHSLTLEGGAGKIEALFSVPEGAQRRYIAVIGHPHSLHGGTMNNKVVTTLVKAFLAVGIVSLRFNFRGVGNSCGEFDKGVGESEDCLNIMSMLKKKRPESQIILAGFSFGAYVTYRAASQSETALLLSVAPAVNHGDFAEFSPPPKPWHVIVAGADEIVPQQEIVTWHQAQKPRPTMQIFENTSHFFHGQLVVLKNHVVNTLQEILNLE